MRFQAPAPGRTTGVKAAASAKTASAARMMAVMSAAEDCKGSALLGDCRGLFMQSPKSVCEASTVSGTIVKCTKLHARPLGAGLPTTSPLCLTSQTATLSPGSAKC